MKSKEQQTSVKKRNENKKKKKRKDTFSAAWDITVAGSCLGSPMRTNRLQSQIKGIRAEGSTKDSIHGVRIYVSGTGTGKGHVPVDCVASSIKTWWKTRLSSQEDRAPTHVVVMTSASFRWPCTNSNRFSR